MLRGTLNGDLLGGVLRKEDEESVRFYQREYRKDPESFLKNRAIERVLDPRISEIATQAYLYGIMSFLKGNMRALDDLLQDAYQRDLITTTARMLFDLVQPFGKGVNSAVVHRGVLLDKKYKEGDVLPFKSNYGAFSYSESLPVACAFSKAGSGHPHVLTTRVTGKQVLFHYAYLQAFKSVFTKPWISANREPESRFVMNPIDWSVALSQQEVLVLNSEKLVQKVSPSKSVCAGVDPYDPSNVEMPKDKYERMFDEPLEKLKRLPPIPPFYKAGDEKRVAARRAALVRAFPAKEAARKERTAVWERQRRAEEDDARMEATYTYRVWAGQNGLNANDFKTLQRFRAEHPELPRFEWEV